MTEADKKQVQEFDDAMKIDGKKIFYNGKELKNVKK